MCIICISLTTSHLDLFSQLCLLLIFFAPQTENLPCGLGIIQSAMFEVTFDVKSIYTYIAHE